MTDWLDQLAGSDRRSSGDRASSHDPASSSCVLISVVHTRGSCPRDTGTRMIVTTDLCYGTIGGGHLEYQAIETARKLLLRARRTLFIDRFALGARLGQCCGGVVELSFEWIPAEKPAWIADLQRIRSQGESAILVTNIADTTHKLIVTQQASLGTLADDTLKDIAIDQAQAMIDKLSLTHFSRDEGLMFESLDGHPCDTVVFGAGHVGRSLVHVLGTLPGRIRWIDSRADAFPDAVPANVEVRIEEHPDEEVDELPAGSLVVIMTHNHALDQTICEQVLTRDDLPWCGLIGSTGKRRRFEKRLLARGVPEHALSKLQCPIGVDGIDGKHPAEIAIAVAAQMLLFRQARQHSLSGHRAA